MEPQNLTPDEILVVQAFAQWSVGRMQRDAFMEEIGIYGDGGWRMQLIPTGQRIGAMPVAREYLLNFYQDDPRWWMKELQEAAENQPRQSYKEFLEEYQAIAQSYAPTTK